MQPPSTMFALPSGHCVATPLIASTLVFQGCSNAKRGAIPGAGVGALSGLAIGSLSGNAGKGAAIGAVVGGVGGGIIGDQNRRKSEAVSRPGVDSSASYNYATAAPLQMLAGSWAIDGMSGGCQPRLSGSLRHEAVSTGQPMSGETTPWILGGAISGKVSSPRTTPRPMDSSLPRPSGASSPTAMGCTTWRATCGSGVATCTGSTPNGSRVRELGPDGAAVNPAGKAHSFDPRSPYEPEVRIVRGGSFLCNDSYCASYRPGARMVSSPDTGLSHAGFRCVVVPKAASSDHTTSSQTVKEIK